MREWGSIFAFELDGFGGNAMDVLDGVGVVQVLKDLCWHLGKGKNKTAIVVLI